MPSKQHFSPVLFISVFKPFFDPGAGAKVSMPMFLMPSNEWANGVEALDGALRKPT